MKDKAPEVPSSGYVKDKTPEVPSTGYVKDKQPEVPSTGYVKENTPEVPSTGYVKDKAPEVPSNGYVKDTAPVSGYVKVEETTPEPTTVIVEEITTGWEEETTLKTVNSYVKETETAPTPKTTGYVKEPVRPQWTHNGHIVNDNLADLLSHLKLGLEKKKLGHGNREGKGSVWAQGKGNREVKGSVWAQGKGDHGKHEGKGSVWAHGESTAWQGNSGHEKKGTYVKLSPWKATARQKSISKVGPNWK